MTDVLTPIDWTRRPYPADTDGPPSPIVFDVVSPRGGNWAIVPRVPGEILTAAKYNADRQAAVDNDTPLSIDDYSNTIAEMGAETNPYPGGAVSQPTSLAGELERIRWCIHQLSPEAPAWYAAPSFGINLGTGSFTNLTVAGTLTVIGNTSIQSNLTVGANIIGQQDIFIPNDRQYRSYWSDGTTGQSLIFMAIDNHINVGKGLPAPQYILLGDGAKVRATGVFEALSGAQISGQLNLQKGQWVYWGDRTGITVDPINNLGLGLNCAQVVVYPPTGFQESAYFLKGKVLWWGDRQALTVDTADNMGIGMTCAGVVAFPPTTFLREIFVNNKITIAKGHWVMATDVAMMAVANDGTNSLWIGPHSPNIHLQGEVHVASHVHVAGQFLTVGTIVAGNQGSGFVHALNTAKAWGRVKLEKPGPQFVAGHGFLTFTKLGTGQARLTLAPNLPGWGSGVATSHGFPTPIVCSTIIETDRSVVVEMRYAATGALVDWWFSVVMY